MGGKRNIFLDISIHLFFFLLLLQFVAGAERKDAKLPEKRGGKKRRQDVVSHFDPA